MNRRLTEQFTVDVSVYAVVRDSSRDFSVDFDLVFGSGATDAFSDTRDSVSLGSGSLLRILPRGFFRNSKFEVPQLLSKIGRSSKVYSTTFVTLNGEPQRVEQEDTRLVSISAAAYFDRW